MPEPDAPPDGSTLIRLGVTPSVGQYLRQVWLRREFAVANASGELRSEHMDTTLGNLWHLLNPILLIAVYYVVFVVILDATRGVENFIGFLSVGIFAYQWATKAITGGARSITGNEGLIRSLQFPRALLPLSTVIKETIAFIPGVAVMVAVVIATGEGVSPSYLLVPLVFALQFLFCLGAALLAARAADVFRDTLNVLPFLFRLVFYGSGILYAVDQRFHGVFEQTWVQVVFVLNPFYCIVSLWRDALMSTQPTSNLGWMWLSMSVWALALFLVGTLVVRAGEQGYGRG